MAPSPILVIVGVAVSLLVTVLWVMHFHIDTTLGPAKISIGRPLLRSSLKPALTTPVHGSVDHSTVALRFEGDTQFAIWKRQLAQKIKCGTDHYLLYYLYHSRRAASSTVREILRSSSPRDRRLFQETEGLQLRSELLSHPSVFSVIAFRHPINRILSLYWYDHVSWHHGMLGRKNGCSSLSAWVDAWKQGGSSYAEARQEFPTSNYIEIENYYVKALSQWSGDKPVDAGDLEKAKQTLMRFDLILITEWLSDETEIDAINALFPGRPSLASGAKMRGDFKMREKLKSTLAPNEAEVVNLLEEMNSWDFQLFDFAQSLAAWRLKHVVPILRSFRGELHVHGVHHDHSNALETADQSYADLHNELKGEAACATSAAHFDGYLEESRPYVGMVKPTNRNGPSTT